MKIKKATEPTQEQTKIIEEDGNLVVTAKPGSGKTFTIIEKIYELSSSLLNYQGVIAISFTRKASQELELRYKRKNSQSINHFFGTIDKFYISEIIIPFAKLLLGKSSLLEIKDSIEDYPHFKDLKKLNEGIVNEQLFELLKESLEEGIIFLEISGETALYILNNVPQSLKYLKARYTHIFIDEYQDCGEVQHKIFLTLVNSGIKGIAVGDLDQAIYAFSNRYSRYLLLLLDSNDFTHLEITHNHRCHKSISKYSLELMGIQQENIENDKRIFKVQVIGNDEDIIHAIERNIVTLRKQYNLSKNSDFAILCRSNSSARRASSFLRIENKLFIDTALDKVNVNWAVFFNDLLLSYYLYHIREVTVLDFVSKYINEELYYKDFRKGLELISKIFKLEENQLKKNIKEFQEIAQLIYPEQKDDHVLKMLQRILVNENELKNFKPASDNEINIMTLHKSKGLEFKCVFLLDLYRWILPPEGERILEEDYIQALNLHYVGVTRAVEACYILLGDFRFRERQRDFIRAIESPFLLLNNTPNLRLDLNW